MLANAGHVSRSVPWRQINADYFLYLRCLDIIERHLDTILPLNVERLAKLAGVSMYHIKYGLFLRYKRLPQLLRQYERNRLRKVFARPRGPSWYAIFHKYRDAFLSLVKKGVKPTGTQIALLLGLRPKSVQKYLRVHPEVKILN